MIKRLFLLTLIASLSSSLVTLPTMAESSTIVVDETNSLGVLQVPGPDTSTPNPEIVVSYNGLYFSRITQTITGTYGNITGDISVPEQIDGLSVKGVDDRAFMECEDLESISFSDGLEYIGNSAFYGCTKLKSILIPETVKKLGNDAFSQCISLEKINIPVATTELGIRTFSNCENLKEILISEGNEIFTSVDGVLYDIHKTEVITYPAGKIDEIYNIPDGVNVIGEYAFSFNKNIKKVVLPETILEIKQSAYYGCEQLEDINFPTNLTTIGDYSFSQCKNLVRVVLPAGIIDIGNSVFSYCSNLKNIIFSQNLSSIGDNAFEFCISMENIDLPETIAEIGDYAFQYSGISSIELPDSLENLGAYSFNGCSNILEVEIPENMKSINEWVFKNCSNLKTIIIPDTVKEIGWGAFDECENLQSVYYYGTEDEWYDINIEKNKNTYLLNATVIWNAVGTEYSYSIKKMEILSSAGEELTEILNNTNFIVDVTINKKQERNEKDYVFVAVYGIDGTLLNLDYVKANFAVNSECSFGFNIPPLKETVGSIKAYVWNDFNSMKPLAGSKSLNF